MIIIFIIIIIKMLDSLILFLLFFLLFLIFLSLIFYYRVKSRQYYFANRENGTQLTYDPKTDDNFYSLRVENSALTFLPFYEDRNRAIRGRIVLTTYSSATASQIFTVRVMNGTQQLSKRLYRINPQVDSTYIYFTASSGEDRKLTVEFQSYDLKSQKPDTNQPTGLNLLSAHASYY